jgi:hypothetical protein
MAAPTLAWGKLHLFLLPDSSHLYGREFELLPGGTMFAAGAILHGLAGVEATIDRDNVARVEAEACVDVHPVRGTCPEELAVYLDDVIEGFRQRQLQDAQG